MNLKESFRYQTFLDNLMSNATLSIQSVSSCLTVTKKHNKSKANPEAKDIEEVIESTAKFKNDDVISFMEMLIREKHNLTEAIGKAKSAADFDIDAAIETNKFRRSVHAAIKRMLQNEPNDRIEMGKDYKFNVEGNQVTYLYEIEVSSKEAYDKERSQNVMRSTIKDSDDISGKIDAAMINIIVDYQPIFDVNESFDDAMTDFIEMNTTK